MDINNEVRVLQMVPMFKDVELARLKLLAFASDRLTFGKGELLFERGDASDSAFVILTGTAEVRLTTPSGPLVVAEIGGNSIVGEMGVLRDAPRSATVAAATDLIALRISREVFIGMIREFPSMSLAMMRDLAERLEATNAKVAALSRA